MSRRLAWCLAGLAVVSPASAQEVLRIPFEQAESGTPALGGGLRIYNRTHIDTGNLYKADVVPLYLYQGERFFMHGTSAGVHLFENDALTVDALARFRYTWFRAEESGYEGLEERKTGADAGLQATLRGRWGELNGLWLTDAIDRHGGDSAELNYRFPFRTGDWTLTPWLSLEWQSEALANYYYGVSRAESEASGLDRWRPGEAVNLGLGLNTAYRLSDSVTLFGNLGQVWLDDDLGDSPIADSGRVTTAYLGAYYSFGPRYRGQPEDVGFAAPWTWRVNAGYAAEGNIVGEVSIGDLRRSKDTDTPIAGLMVGRLLRPGPRVDIYGRLAAFRHFEDGLQDDFFSYALYIMAMAKGYSHWSDREAFRFGFGYGLSYADQVPALEQIKQEKDEERTNRLLTYLELQLDVPLGNYFPGSAFSGCYAGTTVVHRSGIFGSAELFGDVAGGSNWVTLHLECRR